MGLCSRFGFDEGSIPLISYNAPKSKESRGINNLHMIDWITKNKKYIRLEAIARELGIDPRNFRRYIQEGHIPAPYHTPLTKIINQLKEKV